jgi:3-hydroxyacyl-CoA dehydrogenase
MNTPRAASPGQPAAPTLGSATIVAIGDDPVAAELLDRLVDAGATVQRIASESRAEIFSGADILVEASDSPAARRAESLHRLEHDLPPSVPMVAIAGNGPIAPLARALHEPGRLIGLSICAGAGPLRLAEVVSGGGAPAHAEALRNLLAQAGVRTILVADTAGCHARRLARCYANEGLALLGEGVPASLIESSAVEAGMETGPLAMMDAMSLEEADRLLHGAQHGQEHGHAHGHGHEHAHGHGHAHAHAHAHDDEHVHEHGHEHEHGHGHHAGHGHAHGHAHDHAHESAPAAQAHGMTEEAIYVLEKMAHGFNRMGRQAGRGFYDYDEGEPPELWPGLKVFERRRVSIPPEDIRDRLLYRLALESMRCLEEGVVASAADANLSSILGVGFPQASGGAIAFADRAGASAFAARSLELAERYGERFAPPARLAGLSGEAPTQGAGA